MVDMCSDTHTSYIWYTHAQTQSTCVYTHAYSRTHRVHMVGTCQDTQSTCGRHMLKHPRTKCRPTYICVRIHVSSQTSKHTLPVRDVQVHTGLCPHTQTRVHMTSPITGLNNESGRVHPGVRWFGPQVMLASWCGGGQAMLRLLPPWGTWDVPDLVPGVQDPMAPSLPPPPFLSLSQAAHERFSL